MFNSPCMENGLQILPNDLKLYGIWFTILLIDIKILGDRDFYSLLIWFKNLWTFFLSVYSQQRGVALEYQDRDRKLEKPPQKLTQLVFIKKNTHGQNFKILFDLFLVERDLPAGFVVIKPKCQTGTDNICGFQKKKVLTALMGKMNRNGPFYFCQFLFLLVDCSHVLKLMSIVGWVLKKSIHIQRSKIFLGFWHKRFWVR